MPSDTNKGKFAGVNPGLAGRGQAPALPFQTERGDRNLRRPPRMSVLVAAFAAGYSAGVSVFLARLRLGLAGAFSSPSAGAAAGSTSVLAARA